MSALFETISIDDVYPSPSNPRQALDTTALDELADSVREHGILQPVLVRPHPSGRRRGCPPHLGND